MALERNVGGRDRIVRGVLGTTLVVAAVGAVLAGRQLVGVAAALVGAGLLFNAATQFCGVNALLGIDTCSRE
jgi:uncharacterized membrane protein